MRALFALAFAALMSGCLCGGGGTDYVTPTTAGPSTTSTTQAFATPASFTIAPHASSTISTSPTLPPVNCSNLDYYIDRDICWSARAALLKDPTLCKKIAQPDAERICTSILLTKKCTSITNSGLRIVCEASLEKAPERCQKLNHRDIGVCYMSVALYNNDAAVCDKALDKEDKTLCHALTGSCGQLTDPDETGLCRRKALDTIHSLG
ncbi:MAG: hypothetical protein V1875_09045 [Candidatus Altiarchaeota archaeon]